MQYVAIYPKTIINISPQKYGWKHLQSDEALAELSKTTLFINHSDEIIQLSKMITATLDNHHAITTTDNSAFRMRFYKLVRDNLNLGECPDTLKISDIKTFGLTTVKRDDAPVMPLAFHCYSFDLEAALFKRLVETGKVSKDRQVLSKEELETPLGIDEINLDLHPVIDGKVYYLSPIALRYITYIYATLIYQFVHAK